jgi:hypothetical protein
MRKSIVELQTNRKSTDPPKEIHGNRPSAAFSKTIDHDPRPR